jgi:hypothetical protein
MIVGLQFRAHTMSKQPLYLQKANGKTIEKITMGNRNDIIHIYCTDGTVVKIESDAYFTRNLNVDFITKES